MKFAAEHPFLFTFMVLTLLYLVYYAFVAKQQAEILKTGVAAGIITE